MGTLSINDVQSRAWKRYTVVTGNAVLTAPVRIMGAVITHTAAATLIMYNAATQTGTDLIKIGCAADSMGRVDFAQNGTRFDVGLSVTLSAGVATIFYLDE